MIYQSKITNGYHILFILTHTFDYLFLPHSRNNRFRNIFIIPKPFNNQLLRMNILITGYHSLLIQLCSEQNKYSHSLHQNSYNQLIQVNMRRKKRQGFQFSFGLKPEQENYSSKSTPKFPSIEINKSHLSASEKKSNQITCGTQPIQLRKYPLDLFMEIGGGIELLQRKPRTKQKIIDDKIPPTFTLNDNISVDSRDNKSVKSTKSLGQRFAKRNNRIVVQRTIKTNKKHSNSLANILQLKLQSPRKEGGNLFGFKKSQLSFSRVVSEPKEDKKDESQDTLKLQNNLFRSDTSNIEFRQTKKMGQTFQRSKLNECEREKSRIFKNFIHKPRPAIRLAQRTMDNEKIESIARIFQNKSN